MKASVSHSVVTSIESALFCILYRETSIMIMCWSNFSNGQLMMCEIVCVVLLACLRCGRGPCREERDQFIATSALGVPGVRSRLVLILFRAALNGKPMYDSQLIKSGLPVPCVRIYWFQRLVGLIEITVCVLRFRVNLLCEWIWWDFTPNVIFLYVPITDLSALPSAMQVVSSISTQMFVLCVGVKILILKRYLRII